MPRVSNSRTAPPNASRLLRRFSLLVAVCFALGCHSSPSADKPQGAGHFTPPTGAAEAPSSAPEAPAAAPLQRGKPLGNSPAVPLSELLASPEKFAGKSVKTSGLVQRACSTKGCWMQISGSDQPGTQGCRVTFKDYGFFVPTDSVGATATVEGEVQISVVKPFRVKHYESEGAVFPSKNDDGSANEVRLVATGVELRR